MIPSFARVAAASCASAITACVVWTSGGSGGLAETTHAVDTTVVPPLEITRASDVVPLVATPTTTAVAASSVAPAASPTDDAPVVAEAEDPIRLKPCPYDSNCVSSNYLEPPNRYVSPLTTFKDRDAAFARAVRDLRAAEESSGGTTTRVIEILPGKHYIHATVPGKPPGSLDDVELVFVEGGNDGQSIVNLRCQARVTLPPPPFCIQKNCINGNMDQRKRIGEIATTLGLPSADSERMKQSAKWTPIFFNSDRVPGFHGWDDGMPVEDGM